MMRERELFREGKTNSRENLDEGWTVVSRRRRASGPIQRVINENEDRAQFNRMQWWRRKASTIFIDNIPLFYDSYLLKKLFRGKGNIIDIHLPRRKREKKNTRFGFVIFEREEEATRVVRMMNGMSIFGHKLTVEKTFNSSNKSINGGLNFSKEKGDVPTSLNHTNQQLRREGVSYAQMVGKTNQQWREKKKVGDSVLEEENLSKQSKNFVETKLEEMLEKQKEQEKVLADIVSMCLSLNKDIKFLREKFVEICEEESMGVEENQRKKDEENEVEGDNGSLMNEEESSCVPDSIGEEMGLGQQVEGGGTKKMVEGVVEDFVEEESLRFDREDEHIEGETLDQNRNFKENKKKAERRKSVISLNPCSLRNGFVVSRPSTKSMKRKKSNERNYNVVIPYEEEELSSRTVSLEPVIGTECKNKATRVAKDIAWEEACNTVEVGKKVGVTFDLNISSAIEKLVEMDK